MNINILLLISSLVLITLIYLIYDQYKIREGLNHQLTDPEQRILYYKNVRKQGAVDGNLPNLGTDLDKFPSYSNKKEKNMTNLSPGLYNNNVTIGKDIALCKTLQNCDDLDKYPQCGYCEDGKGGVFTAGTKNSPYDYVCPKRKWSLDSKLCKKNKDKQKCSTATECGDLIGDVAKSCAYCPTSGKIVPYEMVNGKAKAKYGEDSCDFNNGELVLGKNCGKFAEMHPCATPNKESGPHNEACLRKLWKNSGCINEKVAGGEMSDLLQIKKSDVELSGMWTNVKKQGDYLNKNYESAVDYTKQCYGDKKKLNPCETRFGVNLDCRQQIFKDEGCDEKGTSYPTKSNLDKNLSNNDFRSRVTQMEKLANKRVLNKDEFVGVKNAAMQCYGRAPQPPDPIKVGDHVRLRSRGWDFKGHVMDIDGSSYSVMWIEVKKNTGQIMKRDKVSGSEIKEFFGWDGIKPKSRTLSWLGDAMGRVQEGELKILKSCSPGITLCDNSCRKIISELRSKYSKPRDCVLGKWGGWSNCSKSCGEGTQTRIRSKIHEEKRGGTCGKLKESKKCNVKPCINNNFAMVDIEKFNTMGIENFDIRKTADLDAKKSIRYIRIRNRPRQYLHIQEIQVFDNNNRNIARSNYGTRPSSSSIGWRASDYKPIDGKVTFNRRNTKYRWPNSNHTKNGKKEWYKLDLRRSVPISRVVIHNRPDCCQYKLRGAKLELLNEFGSVVHRRTLGSSKTQQFYFR